MTTEYAGGFLYHNSRRAFLDWIHWEREKAKRWKEIQNNIENGLNWWGDE